MGYYYLSMTFHYPALSATLLRLDFKIDWSSHLYISTIQIVRRPSLFDFQFSSFWRLLPFIMLTTQKNFNASIYYSMVD